MRAPIVLEVLNFIAYVEKGRASLNDTFGDSSVDSHVYTFIC